MKAALPARLRAFAIEHRLDLAFSGLALLVLLPTFWYRYGLDQSLYQYIGAGWMQGRLPYLRAFDVKPPGIYLVYGLAGLAFKNSEAAIRLAEAACILAVGWIMARVVPRDVRPDGTAGLACFLLAAWNASLFGFWDTGQVELWQAFCLVLSFVTLTSGQHSSRSAFTAGAWFAGAMLFKITAALAAVPLLAIALALAAEGREPARQRVRMVAAFSAGTGAPLLVTAAYFAAFRGGGALVEWLLYLPHYARAPLDAEWVQKIGPESILARCGSWLGILCVPIAAGLRSSLWPRESTMPRMARWAGYLLLAGAASVVLQRRYFSYHPVVLGPLLLLCATPGLALWLGKDRTLTSLGACAVVVGAVLSGPAWTGTQYLNYRSYLLHAWVPFMRGQASRDEFRRSFSGPFEYTYAASESVATLIKTRFPSRGDGLHVRGYDTTLYTLTGLYSPSRFFMEAPLDDYLVSYRPVWAEEHEHALQGESAPRFFVTKVGADGDVRALMRAGYGLVGSRERHVVLERGFRSEPLDELQVSELLTRHRLRGMLLSGIPFELSFEPDGEFRGTIQGSPAKGQWRVTDEGKACASLRPKEDCARFFENSTSILGFDDDWRELVRIEVPLAER